MDILGKAAFRERFDIELFDRNQIVIPHQARARQMKMVGATASSLTVTSLHSLSSLLPLLGTASLSRQRPLHDSQTPLGKATRPQAGNGATVGQHSQGFDPKIEADCPLADA